MKQTILIDARMVQPQGHGIGNYLLDMAVALSRRNLPYRLLYLLSKDCPADSPLRQLDHQYSKIPFLHRLEPWALGKEIGRIAPALFHSPSFMSLWRYPCPHLQTVHDLNHLFFGGPLRRMYYRHLLLPSLKSAVQVIAASESARTELKEWLAKNKAGRSLELARNALPEPAPAETSILKRLGLQEGGYFFCLSNPKPHKNVAMLERAHGKAAGKSLPLVVNLPGPESAGLIRAPGLQAGEIIALYQGARAYFFPSLYEGFGRSPLEAALCGTKPVASDIPPHRENLQRVKEAELLDPKAPELWTNAFLRLTGAPRTVVSEESRSWIRSSFSPEVLGDSMERIYRESLR